MRSAANLSRAAQGTFRAARLNPRAERELLDALCYLARMGDSLEELKRYSALSGALSPLDAYTDREGRAIDLLNQKYHRDVLLMRDYLRWVWKREDVRGITLRTLLGLDPRCPFPGLRHKPFPADEMVGISLRFKGAQGSIPVPSISPNLQTGEIEYRPQTCFQQAMFALLKNGWRARVCDDCDQFYVADKQAQRYCSTRCGKERKKRYDRRYWQTRGNAKRKARQAREKSERKRGK